MMGRRLREWPRLVAAIAVAAVLLVVVGVVVASASSGGTKTVTAKPAAAVTSAPKPAAPSSNGDKQQIAKLQAELKRQSTELTDAQHALSASKSRTRCWRIKARHPKKDRTVRCPTGSLSQ
jgi:septal ring factor EnvC (AmiA/AmiB activator)